MPSYSYKAFDSEGTVQSGFINAESERLARKEIKSLNLIPHKLKEIKSQTTKRYKIKNKDLVLATRQIGTLLEAAAQIDEALKMTAEQVKNKDLKSDKGKDNLIRNYGIGAQIIKDLKINKMILITKTPKKVVGLEGYNIKITKQELI